MILPKAIQITLWVALLSIARPIVGVAQSSTILEVFTKHRAFVDQKAPSAVVQIPAHTRLDDALNLVVFLHGWNGCARALMARHEVACDGRSRRQPGWNLAQAHELSGTPTLLVIPQLAFLQRTGDPGAFRQSHNFRAFLAEVLAQIGKAQHKVSLTYESVRSITLVAHSAGYETALAIIEQGGVSAKLANIVLLDSLYSRPERFAKWLSEHPSGRLVSIFQGRGKTYHMNRRLSNAVKHAIDGHLLSETTIENLSSVPRCFRALVMQSTQRHGAMPSKHLTPVLKWLWH